MAFHFTASSLLFLLVVCGLVAQSSGIIWPSQFPTTSPIPSASETSTSEPSVTSSGSDSAKPTPSESESPTASETSSVTVTASGSVSSSPTSSWTSTSSQTTTYTGTASASVSATASLPQSASNSGLASPSTTASSTVSASESGTLQPSASSSVSPTATPTPSTSMEATASETSSGTAIPSSSTSATASATPSQQSSQAQTVLASPSVSPTTSAGPSGSSTVAASGTVSRTPAITASGSKSITASSMSSATASVAASISNTISVSLSSSPSNTISPSESASATGSETGTTSSTPSASGLSPAQYTCVYSSWTFLTECSVACGGGVRLGGRQVISYSPQTEHVLAYCSEENKLQSVTTCNMHACPRPDESSSPFISFASTLSGDPLYYSRDTPVGVINRERFRTNLISAIATAVASGESTRLLVATGGAHQLQETAQIPASNVFLGDPVNYNSASNTFDLPWRIQTSNMAAQNTTALLQTLQTAIISACTTGGLQGTCTSLEGLQVVSDPAATLRPDSDAGGDDGLFLSGAGLVGLIVGSIAVAAIAGIGTAYFISQRNPQVLPLTTPTTAPQAVTSTDPRAAVDAIKANAVQRTTIQPPFTKFMRAAWTDDKLPTNADPIQPPNNDSAEMQQLASTDGDVTAAVIPLQHQHQQLISEPVIRSSTNNVSIINSNSNSRLGTRTPMLHTPILRIGQLRDSIPMVVISSTLTPDPVGTPRIVARPKIRVDLSSSSHSNHSLSSWRLDDKAKSRISDESLQRHVPPRTRSASPRLSKGASSCEYVFATARPTSHATSRSSRRTRRSGRSSSRRSVRSDIDDNGLNTGEDSDMFDPNEEFARTMVLGTRLPHAALEIASRKRHDSADVIDGLLSTISSLTSRGKSSKGISSAVFVEAANAFMQGKLPDDVLASTTMRVSTSASVAAERAPTTTTPAVQASRPHVVVRSVSPTKRVLSSTGSALRAAGMQSTRGGV